MSKSEREKWEAHNESFNYDPPEGPPETWSSEDYEELHDRLVQRQVTWVCQKCSQPFGRLEKARSHVGRKHGEHLYQKYGDSE